MRFPRMIPRLRSRRQGGHYCPGPRRGLTRFLAFHRLFIRTGCFYDLAGLPTDSPITCPECGHQIVSLAEALRTTRRARILPMALALLMAAACAGQYLYSWKWLPHAPNMVLVAAETLPARYRISRLGRELDRRFWRNQLGQTSGRALMPLLVRDLKDDDVRSNADRAINYLTRFRTDAVPHLRKALRSSDWQQRQLAAHILRQVRQYAPCDDLLRITIEGLRDDNLPHTSAANGSRTGRCLWVNNAHERIEYLVKHPQISRPYLAEAMRSDDPQQRYYAAVIAARTRDLSLIEPAAEILIERLAQRRGNYNPSDALTAYGPAILPRLVPVLESSEARKAWQARQILMSLQEELKLSLSAAQEER
jgi:hypothetical protein